MWAESIYQAKCLIKRWEGALEGPSGIARFKIQDDLKTLAFHILNRAGFGVRLQWPGASEPRNDANTEEEANDVLLDDNNLEWGQGMRFGEAMLLVVDHLKELFIFPKWVLSKHFLRSF